MVALKAMPITPTPSRAAAATMAAASAKAEMLGVPGDLIEVGRASNYGDRNLAKFVYLTATLDAAIWGAELALGEGRERIYLVEPTGAIEDDPDLTDRKFPGNPTRSYRSLHPFRVVGEVVHWQGHAPEQVKTMLDHLEKLKEEGVDSLND